MEVILICIGLISLACLLALIMIRRDIKKQRELNMLSTNNYSSVQTRQKANQTTTLNSYSPPPDDGTASIFAAATMMDDVVPKAPSNWDSDCSTSHSSDYGGGYDSGGGDSGGCDGGGGD